MESTPEAEWTMIDFSELHLLRANFQKAAKVEIKLLGGPRVKIYPPENVRKFLSIDIIAMICDTLRSSRPPYFVDESAAIHERFLQTSEDTIKERFCLILGVLIEDKGQELLPYFVYDDLDDSVVGQDNFTKAGRLKQFHERYGLPDDLIDDFWNTKKYFFLRSIIVGEQVFRSGFLLPIDFNHGALLGEGSYGKVYAGTLIPGLHRNDLGCTSVAVKEFKENNVEERNHEYRQIQQFKHRNILPALCSIDHETDGETSHYIVYKRAESSLKQRLRTEIPDNHGSPLGILKRYMELLDALRYLHNARFDHWSYHFDIKSSNILCMENGALVLNDFGASHLKPKYTLHDQDSGTATAPGFSGEYAAPDPQRGKIGRKFDVWAIGCIGVELLVWIEGGPRAVTTFKQARVEDGKGERDQTGLFYIGQGEDLRLRPSVEQALGRLEKRYPEEIYILRHMLKTEPADRLAADVAYQHFVDRVNVGNITYNSGYYLGRGRLTWIQNSTEPPPDILDRFQLDPYPKAALAAYISRVSNSKINSLDVGFEPVTADCPGALGTSDQRVFEESTEPTWTILPRVPEEVGFEETCDRLH